MPKNFAPILKAGDTEEHLVFAEVYAPNRPDSDGEFMDPDTIKKMAYEFMKTLEPGKVIDHRHSNEIVNGARVVESFIARKEDPDGFIEGAWVIGLHIDNEEMWKQIKKGEINGFSIEALVHKKVVPIEIEMPPVISGKTQKSEDHIHTFYVGYDENGKFIGGKTNVVNGHAHVIKRGTLTEEAEGHTHKFSHLDELQLKEVA
jgi:hypothetical protein